MTLYAELRQRTNDDPSRLVGRAERDERTRKLSEGLSFAASFLRFAEDSRPKRFARPADRRFIRAWRDFEERYERAVDDVVFLWLMPELGKEDPWANRPELDRLWEIADSYGEDAAHGLDEVFAFARDQADPDWGHPEDYVEQIEGGLREWDHLKGPVGLDVRGVVRRRRLVPFVLVPGDVAAKYPAGDKGSMFENLKDAQNAFVFGAPLAAIAMMRSILDAVLRDHYGAKGNDLNARTNNAHDLPSAANAASLHRLRRRANLVLHLRQEKEDPLPPLDPTELENEIASLLRVLRALIEGAPPQRV